MQHSPEHLQIIERRVLFCSIRFCSHKPYNNYGSVNIYVLLIKLISFQLYKEDASNYPLISWKNTSNSYSFLKKNLHLVLFACYFLSINISSYFRGREKLLIYTHNIFISRSRKDSLNYYNPCF